MDERLLAEELSGAWNDTRLLRDELVEQGERAVASVLELACLATRPGTRERRCSPVAPTRLLGASWFS
ncbi:hypothetical protein ACWDRR_39510 [Kitasatospora sp. NPDC003701]